MQCYLQDRRVDKGAGLLGPPRRSCPLIARKFKSHCRQLEMGSEKLTDRGLCCPGGVDIHVHVLELCKLDRSALNGCMDLLHHQILIRN